MFRCLLYLSDIYFFTVAECKKNWKHLRFGLSRSLKPTIDGSVRKKYYLHDEMVFVLPFLKLFPRKIGGYVAPAIESGDTDEDNTETLEKSQSPHNTFFDLEVLQHKPPRKGISAEAVNNQLDNHTTERVECSRRMFLLSLLPEVNELTESQMRAFRRKVLYLIDEIMETPNQM